VTRRSTGLDYSSTGSSYTLPTMIDAVDSLTTQLTYHKRHTINAAAANTTTARNDTEPACF